MSAPTYSETTEKAYSRLPSAYQVLDEQYGYLLKSYLSAIGDQMGDIETLLNRFEVVAPGDYGTLKPKSDLGDPAAADPAWFAWLGEVLGVRLGPGLTDDQKRALLADPTSSYEVGTKQSIIDAVKVYLVGAQYTNLQIVDMWHITITIHQSDIAGSTYADLTNDYPTYQDLMDAYQTYADFGSVFEKMVAAAQNVKPAGVSVTIIKG